MKRAFMGAVALTALNSCDSKAANVEINGNSTRYQLNEKSDYKPLFDSKGIYFQGYALWVLNKYEHCSGIQNCIDKPFLQDACLLETSEGLNFSGPSRITIKGLMSATEQVDVKSTNDFQNRELLRVLVRYDTRKPGTSELVHGEREYSINSQDLDFIHDSKLVDGRTRRVASNASDKKFEILDESFGSDVTNLKVSFCRSQLLDFRLYDLTVDGVNLGQ
jgi:hypothetical protein